MFHVNHLVFSTWDEVLQFAWNKYKLTIEGENIPTTIEEMEKACRQLESYIEDRRIYG